MKLDVVDITGKKTGDIEVSDAIFARTWNRELVHQIFVALQANLRRPWAHTKTRDEVSGGGKKPWRQKGTGRARHGSTRSPIWVGGGVSHGPRNDKDYSQKINKKMKKGAFYSVLSRKVSDDQLKVVDGITAKSGKTKALNTLLLGFYNTKEVPSTLIVSKAQGVELVLAAQNLPKVKVVTPDVLSILDLLNYETVLIEKESVQVIV